MSIAVTNQLTGHLCLPPLSVPFPASLPASPACFPCLLPLPCSASRTGTCSLSIYASAWTAVAGAFWNYQAKYSLRCLRISISRCTLSLLHSTSSTPLPPSLRSSCMRNYVFVQRFCREPLNMPPTAVPSLLPLPLVAPAATAAPCLISYNKFLITVRARCKFISRCRGSCLLLLQRHQCQS